MKIILRAVTDAEFIVVDFVESKALKQAHSELCNLTVSATPLSAKSERENSVAVTV